MATNGGPLARFKKDDVVIPRRNLKDKDWRASTVIVTEHLEDGTLLGFPSAGGYYLRFPPDKVREFDFVKIPQEMLERPVFHKARFDADWMPEGKTYLGWTTGELWNGWGTPYFEKNVAQKVVADLEERWTKAYDPEKDEYVLTSESEEEPYVIPAETIHVEDRGRWKSVKVYPIGAGYWTWNAPKYV